MSIEVFQNLEPGYSPTEYLVFKDRIEYLNIGFNGSVYKCVFKNAQLYYKVEKLKQHWKPVDNFEELKSKWL